MPARRKQQPGIDPRYACYPLRVRRSRIHRWGVFAAEPIPAGRKVIEYAGERINQQEVRRRAQLSQRRKRIVIARLNRRWSVDPARDGSGAEYINHCCSPNLYARKTTHKILLFSRRRIAAGEELSFDYRLPPGAERIPCRCRSADCRGMLNRAARPASRSRSRGH